MEIFEEMDEGDIKLKNEEHFKDIRVKNVSYKRHVPKDSDQPQNFMCRYVELIVFNILYSRSSFQIGTTHPTRLKFKVI